MSVVFEQRKPLDLPIPVWTDLGMAVGASVSTVEQNVLERAAGLAEAKEIALRYLRFRSHTTKEVSRHLVSKGVNTADADRVVGELTTAGLLSDQAYAAAYHALKQATWSRAQIRFKLRERGIRDDVMRSIVDGQAAHAAECDTARRVAAKYWHTQSSTPQSKRAAKLVGYLGRRGFPTDVIRLVTSEWAQVEDSDWAP